MSGASGGNGYVESRQPVHHQLEVREVVCDGQRRLVLSGELDMDSCSVLEDALIETRRNGSSAVTLDLSKVTFMDSTGLRTVLAARELCAMDGSEFMLIPGQPQVQRVFELSGLMDCLPFRTPA